MDRDGEVINTGDVVYDDYGNRWIVKKLVFEETPTHCPVQVSNHEDNNVTLNGFMPYSLTHRPPVTVESVLRELVDTYKNCCDRPGTIAEYAKRLRLVEVDE